MKKIQLFGLVTLVLLAGACACSLTTIEGSGHVTTESRDVGGFHGLALSNIGEVLVVQTGQESLTVEADDNLFQYIKSEVRDGTLHLGLTASGQRAIFRPTQPIRFRLTVKTLDEIAVSGSGLVRADALESETLAIAVNGSGSAIVEMVSARVLNAAVSGSGQIRVGGQVPTQAVAVSGSGSYQAPNLRSASASAAVSGSGAVVLWAAEALTAEISGSGTISYYGTPSISESITGSGQLRALGLRHTDL